LRNERKDVVVKTIGQILSIENQKMAEFSQKMKNLEKEIAFATGDREHNLIVEYLELQANSGMYLEQNRYIGEGLDHPRRKSVADQERTP